MKPLWLAFLFVLPCVLAQPNFYQVLDQNQLNQLDFSTLDLGYTFDKIKLINNEGIWELRTGVFYYSINPVYPAIYDENGNVIGSTTKYEVVPKNTFYVYKEADFFECFVSTGSDTDCFFSKVWQKWLDWFVWNDWLHRRYLRSLQTLGTPMLSPALENLLTP